MTTPLSIITCVHNRRQYLGQTIQSVLAQTYPAFEYLIWDDGSTDGSLELAHAYAKRDSRIRVMASDNQGIAPATRAAVENTTGTYLGWVDSDDRLAPTALEEMARVLDQNPAIGMAYSNYQVIDAHGRLQGLGSRCTVSYSPHTLLVQFMTFHFRLLRRTAYDAVGGIDPTFVRASDYDLCLRLSEATAIAHLPRALYEYRHHADNMTLNQLEQVRWAYQASCTALKRRGMDQTHSLTLEVNHQFVLQPK